tara:strand:+ start:472 stop:1740 length:1269 start_codon:yes stop_codon:yes gene_type:complete
MINHAKFKICVIGLGYVGLPLVIEFSKKFKVIGYDVNSKRVESLNKNIDYNNETISKITNNNLKITDKTKDIKSCNFYIIAVPTPINKNNKPNILMLKRAARLVGSVIKKNDIVVVESTVYPGCTRNDCIPIISKHSNLVPEKDFHFGYSPERINPGDKEHTLKNIKKVISGSNKFTISKLKLVYGSIIQAGLHIAPSIEIAEAAKVIENTQRDLNIAFMNELSVIFNNLNISTKDVLKASSTKWNFLKFEPGLVGGHCIGVDPYYLSYISEANGYKPKFLISGRKINNSMPKIICKKIINISKEKNIKSNVLILGLTFKKNVNDLRNSKVFEIFNILKNENKNISLYDPLVQKNELEKKYHKYFLNKKPKNISKFSIIIFAVAHKDLLSYYPKKLYESYSKNNLIVDLTLKLNKNFVNIGF